MTSRMKTDMGVMTTLPYSDPLDDAEKYASVRRGRTIKVKYNMRTAFIQGIPDAKYIPSEPSKENLRKVRYYHRKTRPGTCSILKPKQTNIPPPILKNSKQNLYCLSYLQDASSKIDARSAAKVYKTLSSALKAKGPDNNVFALNSFLSKLVETTNLPRN